MSKFPRLEGSKALNVLRLASAGVHLQTCTIGGEVYELTTRDDLALSNAAHKVVDVHAGTTVKAQGKYTLTGQPQDGGTLTINGKVYTFQTTLTNIDGHVLISAVNAEGSIDNLVAAVNGGGGRGTKYATATTTHTTVTASKSSTDKIIITAIAGGTVGNAYTLAEVTDNLTKDAATLGTTTLGVDPSAGNVCDALLAAINALTAHRIEARKISANELVIQSKIESEMVLACTETLAGANNAWAATAMYGGRLTRNRRQTILKRVPTAVEIALDHMHFELDFTPTIATCKVVVTSTPGVAVAWDGGITISGTHVTIDNGGSTDWTASHTLEVTLIE